MKGNLWNQSRPYRYTGLAWLIIGMVVVFPILYTGYISLTNMNIFHWLNFRYIGFANYLRAFSQLDRGFLVVLCRTLLWTAINLVLQVVIALALALMLGMKDLKFSGFYKTVLMIPWAVPGYITALIWRNGMFHNQFGLLNQILNGFGLNGVQWLNRDVMAFISCLIVNLWMALPFMILVIYGGLQSIDRSFYEVAAIDGVGWFTRITRITLPLIKPILIPAVTLTAFVTFKQFDIVYLMTQQIRTGANTHLVITYAYENAFATNNYGFSSALSVIIFAIILFFTILNQKHLKQGVNE